MEKGELKVFIPEFPVGLQTSFHSFVVSSSELTLQAEIVKDITAGLGLS